MMAAVTRPLMAHDWARMLLVAVAPPPLLHRYVWLRLEGNVPLAPSFAALNGLLWAHLLIYAPLPCPSRALPPPPGPLSKTLGLSPPGLFPPPVAAAGTNPSPRNVVTTGDVATA